MISDKHIPAAADGSRVDAMGDRLGSAPEHPADAAGHIRQKAIVRPVNSRNSPRLGPFAFMVSTGPDINRLAKLCGSDHLQSRPLFLSRLFIPGGKSEVAIAGPVLGAPYAAMVLETLAAWGVRQVIYMGWCGALTSELAIGDVLLPTGAYVDEGTSRHYNGQWENTANGHSVETPLLSQASEDALNAVRNVFQSQGVSFREGLVWTTDGVYRETPEKVEYYRHRNALAVEMEISALYSAGKSLGLSIGAIVVVSDLLSTQSWKPGFKDQRFVQGREQVLLGMKQLAAVWKEGYVE